MATPINVAEWARRVRQPLPTSQTQIMEIKVGIVYELKELQGRTQDEAVSDVFTNVRSRPQYYSQLLHIEERLAHTSTQPSPRSWSGLRHRVKRALPHGRRSDSSST